MPPTKDELSRDLERERQRALLLALQQFQTAQTQGAAQVAAELAALRAAMDARTAAENARLDLEKQRPVRRMVDGFLASDWRGRLAYLAPLIVCLVLGYSLAAGVSPAAVAGDLLTTTRMCFGAANGPATPSAPPDETRAVVRPDEQ